MPAPVRFCGHGRTPRRSTVNDRFRVTAASLERTARKPAFLSPTGKVEVTGKVVQFIRPGLIEEYSVSMDGVRQDFVIEQNPPGEGALQVELVVTGAKGEPTAYGAQLVLEKSGRKIAYSRLRVTDANAKELPARIEMASNSTLRTPHSATVMAVEVDDAQAVYPIRIDPTFSDANWISMGGIPGANGRVSAAAADGSGNLYIGGEFTLAGDVFATNIAKWNGSRWSALGSGVDNSVSALAVLGPDLDVGGPFTAAEGKVSACLAMARIGSIAKSVAAANSSASVQFSGVTGYQYDVQRTTNLNPPITWTIITTNPLSPAPDGSFTFTDSNAPSGTAYYRAVER